jgi:hypothetical protein
MSQSGKCPHFNEQTNTCSLLRKLQGKSGNARRWYQEYMMMGVTPADANRRAGRCLSSTWAECAVHCNEQDGSHR